MTKKRKRPLEVPNSRRVDVLIPVPLVNESKQILKREGISLSSYIRRTLRRLTRYPELVLLEMRGVPETFYEDLDYDTEEEKDEVQPTS